MDTIQSGKAGSPLKTVKRRTPAEFQKELEQAGISVNPLEVTEVKPGPHERAEGITARPICRIVWSGKPARLLGLLPLPHTNGGSGRFVQVSPRRINMPPEAGRRYDIAHSIAAVDKSTVFLSTVLADSHLDAMLAVRVADRWLELYRWHASWAELGLSRLEICQF